MKNEKKRIIAYWILHRLPAAQDVRGTSSTPASVSAPPLAPVKPSTKKKIASRSEAVSSIQIGAVEGEAERERLVGTAVVGEVVGSGGVVLTALPPSVPPQLQLVRLYL